jgi:hypothetical protein
MSVTAGSTKLRKQRRQQVHPDTGVKAPCVRVLQSKQKTTAGGATIKASSEASWVQLLQSQQNERSGQIKAAGRTWAKASAQGMGAGSLQAEVPPRAAPYQLHDEGARCGKARCRCARRRKSSERNSTCRRQVGERSGLRPRPQ